ncbi:MAG: hypothetical protein ACOCG5_08575 [Candidatus Alkaliphilus sp. MAG34]
MNLEEVINQLINLRGHCEDFMDVNDKNCIWKKDIEALEIAINFVKGNRREDACETIKDCDKKMQALEKKLVGGKAK